MKFERVFSDGQKSAYDQFRYEWRQSTIKNESGDAVSRSIEVEVPAGWSQLATDILAQKYLRQEGVPQVDENGNPKRDGQGKPVLGAERSVRQVVDRLAGCWQKWGDDHGYFDTPQDSQVFYDETAFMLLSQMAAPNSPQWFNTGLALRYGIRGEAQGHWYVDPKDGELKPGEDAFSRPQPHACFIQAVEDDLMGESGIYSLLAREGRIFKFGSGTGTNFSNIRGDGEPLGSGGFSSGLMSFLKIYDRAAGAIKSGGTTRRAAKMVCLDMDHPEVEAFIDWKAWEEKKVGALAAGSRILKKQFAKLLSLLKECEDLQNPSDNLMLQIHHCLELGMPESLIQRILQLAAQGIYTYDMEEIGTDFEGDGYNTVSGQNSNNSLRVPHRFMSEVARDGDWELKRRVDGKTYKLVKAKKLWDKLTLAAWECADPGVQFDDTINEWHTCPVDGRIKASNPCSEYMFLDDTACNLASLNLDKFLMEDGTFDLARYEHAARLWTVVLEISVTMAQFPSREIAKKSYEYRTLGLGYANLGCILMKMGIPYDSPEAAGLTGALTAILTGISYATSAEMAHHLGPFARYEANKEDMLRVIRNHRRAAYGAPNSSYEKIAMTPKAINPKYSPSYLLDAARKAWDQALEMGNQYGYRNAQVSVIAPTGTIGLLMDCDTTGIEPDFSLIKFKKLSGGGYFKIINQSIEPALEHLKYTPEQIRDIVHYCVGHGSLDKAPHVNTAALLEKGLSKDLLARVTANLKGAFHITQAFMPYILTEDEKKKFKVPDNLDMSFNLLSHLGFTGSQIEEANLHVCGTQTVEGAPHLSPDHLPVFDCANKCGPRGTRFIAARGHLRLMAAAQPFISGAISKTINMPNSASPADIADIYKESWEMGLKSVAIYRDGSKLSQPLSSESKLSELITQARDYVHNPEPRKMETVEKQWPQKKRRALPHRREGFVQEATVGGHKLFLRTGEYPDGELGEIFIDMYKEGASYRGLLNCFAVLTSKALQYGVPLKTLVDSFTFTRFEPSGPVTGHDHIKSSTSILDFIFRTIGHHYLGREEFLHVKPIIQDVPETTREAQQNAQKERSQVENPESRPVHYAVQSKTQKAYVESRRAGYTGDSCGSCGSMRVRRNGTCTVCDDCGSTSGCS